MLNFKDVSNVSKIGLHLILLKQFSYKYSTLNSSVTVVLQRCYLCNDWSHIVSYKIGESVKFLFLRFKLY